MKGTLVTATNPMTNHTISRNTSHFKQITDKASIPRTVRPEEELGGKQGEGQSDLGLVPKEQPHQPIPEE